MLRRFVKLGICSNTLAKAIFVTDQNATTICALQPYGQLNCCTHLLDTVLCNTFAEEFIAEEADSTHENLQKVKCLVNSSNKVDKPVKSAAEFYRRSQHDGTLKLAIL